MHKSNKSQQNFYVLIKARVNFSISVLKVSVVGQRVKLLFI